MDTFARPLASVLSYIYAIVPNYAISIILLTLVVMIVLLPLTLKATRSMLAMQRIAPDLKKLQDKHKNDRVKLNQEVMALYKDNRINPVSGCLPMLLQLPVLIVLYQVIIGLTKHTGNIAHPKHLSTHSKLYEDLVKSGGHMKSFGIDLSLSARAHHATTAAAIPFYVLILVMVFCQYYQQKQITSRAPKNADNPQAQMMKTMQRFYPPFFGLISLGFPAALVLYWVVSSIFRIGQQWAIYEFDPQLKATVANAHKEAEKFLSEGTSHGRAQKSPGRASGKSQAKSTKKRKGK